jgi:aryl-alcohol dehydrogenase-like predicted oxidoreductase
LRHCGEQSARTLGADSLYYLHAVDPAVPLAESLGELIRLREGKIAAIGLSNINARHLDEALLLTPIAAVRIGCNVLSIARLRLGARRALPRARHRVRALLTRRRTRGTGGDQYPALARIATKHGATPYVIALAWLLAQGPHILPIPGATKVSSIESSLTAPRVRLDAEDLAALAALGSRKRGV